MAALDDGAPGSRGGGAAEWWVGCERAHARVAHDGREDTDAALGHSGAVHVLRASVAAESRGRNIVQGRNNVTADS